MKLFSISKLLVLISMVAFVYLSFILSETVFDAQKYNVGFVVGFIGGIAWLLLVITDPKSKYYYKKYQVDEVETK